MESDLYQKAKDGLLWKLENVLKGDALLLKENGSISSEERLARMKVIEDITRYIRAYDKNIQLLEEYEDFKYRMLDDGR